MKTIKNIIIVLIFGAIIAFLLQIMPNFEKGINSGKTNLVINYKNVTAKLKNKIIIDNNNIYIDKDDIENVYDKYILFEEKQNIIVAIKDDKTAVFDINKGTLNINGNVKKSKILEKDGTKYIPITDLKDVYNIDIKYSSKYDIVSIDSKDIKLETAKVRKNSYIMSLNTIFSKPLEKINANAKLTIVPNVKNTNYNGFTKVKTENGHIGFIQTKLLIERKIERDAVESNQTQDTISMVWDYFSKYGKAPVRTNLDSYEGVNVVCPSLFYLEKGSIQENVGDRGTLYINWARSKGYKVWAMVHKESTMQKSEFSEMISNYSVRQTLISQIVDKVKTYKLDGINLDFENINVDDKDNYSRFIIELAPKLKSLNCSLSVDVTEPDGSDSWSLCYDREVIGDVADYIIFMAYDQHGKYSKTEGSNAAYNWVERNLNKFINQENVKSNKIILALPLYTRLWEENDSNIKAYDVSMKNVDKYIKEAGSTKWLDTEKQNYIEYSKNGKTYKMWVEDDKSISAKLELIEKYKIAGAAFWAKGQENSTVFGVINEKILKNK